jgi:ATP-dependent Clp endopeptidase proteolytic subunit ClpP
LKYFVNKSKKEFEIILSGDVGFDIKGKEIANEIRYLNTIGATKITERINSGGGFVTDGYDIVDANLNSEAIIETVITGLAASTAGWLAATGTNGHRFIVDYGKGMIHDPSIGNQSIDDMPDGPDKNGLISIKDSISTILSNNSNLKKEKINQLMSAETWLSADEWVSMGFADKVISTTDKPIIKDSYNILEFVNACSEFNNKQEEKPLKIDNTMDIKELENKAENLNGQLTVKDDTISSLENKVTEKDAKIEEVENKLTAKTDEVADLQNKVKAFELKEVENAVKAAVDSGKFGKDSTEKLTAQCEAMGVENFNEMVEMVVMPKADAAAQVQNSATGEAKKTKDETLAEEYQKLATDDPQGLKDIKNSDPARYEEMFNAWNQA